MRKCISKRITFTGEEVLTHNQRVAGSIPAGPTTIVPKVSRD